MFRKPAANDRGKLKFPELVTIGKFTHVDDPICDPECDKFWDNKGDHVRGEFEVLDMNGGYTIDDADTKTRKVSGLYMATVYELVAYAISHPHVTGTIAAFASSYKPYGNRQNISVACLYNYNGRRRLHLELAKHAWSSHTRVLYIRRQ